MDYDISIKISGEVIPSSFIDLKYDIEDLDVDSIRDINNGILDRNRIRQGVFKLNITYAITGLEDIQKVLRLTEPVEFQVEILNLRTLTRTTHTMYCAKKSTQLVKHEKAWTKGLSFSLTEC